MRFIIHKHIKYISSRGDKLNYTIKISYASHIIYLFKVNYGKLRTLVVILNHQNITPMGLAKEQTE